MANVIGKRKAPESRNGFEKRQRIETTSPLSAHKFKDDDEDDFQPDNDDFSDNEQTVGTPVTPFSPGPGSGPGRKKFPSELKTIKCTFEGCNKTFNRPARLTAHLRTHTGDRAFVCMYEGCDKAYFHDKHLQAHIRGSHTHDRSYECDEEGCGKSFLTSTRLKRHKDTHAGKNRFRCTAYPPCNQTFRKHQTLQRHINSDHLQLAPYQCTHIDPSTGAKCPAGFDGANGLRQHVERLHGFARFFCPDCIVPGQYDLNGDPIFLGFSTEREFQAHIRKEHANCPFCDLKCRSQKELQKHIDNLHSINPVPSLEERKNIPCTYAGCDRKFTKNNNLNAHIRTAHMGERFICGNYDVSSYRDVAHFDDADGCGSEFTAKQYLADHIRTAHLKLPSLVNAKRMKTLGSDIETDDDDEYMDDDFIDDEDVEESKKRAKRRGRKAKPDVVGDLIGTSYANNPRRKIPCPVFQCQHRFMREYDLQVHLRTLHEGWTPDMGPALPDFNTGAAFQYPEPSMGTFSMLSVNSYAQPLMNSYDDSATDIDWELQRRALEGGAFWVGGDDKAREHEGDLEWDHDAKEMRRLIG